MAKILLVDDSKTLLKHVQQMLTAAGHEVIPILSGREAVQVLEANAVDLVLTDLYMPPPDGFELVDAVRAMASPPPLIVMSSNTQACDVFRGTQVLGAVATLAKPFTAAQLTACVDAALGRTSAPAAPAATPALAG